MEPIPFTRDTDPPVSGFLHRAESASPSAERAIVLTHGAGSNCQAPLLVAVSEAFAAAGIRVLRIDLPYRQKRPHGPPFPGEAARDRQGLRNAIEALGTPHNAPAGGPGNSAGAQRDAPLRGVYLGGHSYGGRQVTMLAAEDPTLACGLLLMSYPLHPPNQPARLRTDHFPALRADALFVHGTRDPFASTEEIEQALKLIPARALLLQVEGAGHDLRVSRRQSEAGDGVPLPQRIVQTFLEFHALKRSACARSPIPVRPPHMA